MDAATELLQEHRYAGAEWREELERLQRALIHAGFEMLRPGGVLVYATCSSDSRQNQAVVHWLLDREPSAKLGYVDSCGIPATRYGGEGMLLLAPNTSGTSGLFVCCLTKTY